MARKSKEIREKTGKKVVVRKVDAAAKRKPARSKKSAPKAGLPVGSAAPDFTLPDHDGRPTTLASLLRATRGGPLVLYFYPEADTPACTMQACELSDLLPQLGKLGVAVAAISPDQPAELRAFRDKFKLGFPLLGDSAGVDGVPNVMAAYGAYGQKNMYGRMVTGVIRSTILIGADGKVVQHWPVVRATGHAAKVMEAVRGLG